MGLFDRFMGRRETLGDPDEARAFERNVAQLAPSAPLLPADVQAEVQHQQVGSYAWQMEQLAMSERRSDRAGDLAKFHLRDQVARGNFGPQVGKSFREAGAVDRRPAVRSAPYTADELDQG